MKKLLLGLGAVSIATLPVLAVVSCSLTQQTIDLKISKYSDITTVSKEMIDKTIVDFELAKTEFDNAKNENDKKLAKDKQITTLNLIFNGITIFNIDHFQITLNKETSSIELKGLENYVFGASPILLATPSPTPTKVTGITGADKEITTEEYKTFEESFKGAKDEQKMIEALNLLLKGVTQENLNLFKIKIIDNVKVIFIAIPDYYFTDDNQTFITISAPIATLTDVKIAAQTSVTKIIYDEQMGIFNTVDATDDTKLVAIKLIVTGIEDVKTLNLFSFTFGEDKLIIAIKDVKTTKINGSNIPFEMLAPTPIVPE